MAEEGDLRYLERRLEACSRGERWESEWKGRKMEGKLRKKSQKCVKKESLCHTVSDKNAQKESKKRHCVIQSVTK